MNPAAAIVINATAAYIDDDITSPVAVTEAFATDAPALLSLVAPATTVAWEDLDAPATTVGAAVAAVGAAVTAAVGADVTAAVGTAVGADVTVDVGTAVGVGVTVDVGAAVGVGVTVDVGAAVGVAAAANIVNVVEAEPSVLFIVILCEPAPYPSRTFLVILTIVQPSSEEN